MKQFWRIRGSIASCRVWPVLGCLLVLFATAALAADDLKVLFLGDNGHHKPRERFAHSNPCCAARHRADLHRQVDDLNPANAGAIRRAAAVREHRPHRARARTGAVGLCRRRRRLRAASLRVVLLSQLGCVHRADRRTVRAPRLGPHARNRRRHRASRDAGYGGFESWDETYVHTKHNEKDRTVLEYRVEGDEREPWTWVRTHGKGRVFYTAWGHDQRTWGNPGFRIWSSAAFAGPPAKIPAVARAVSSPSSRSSRRR